MSIRSIASLAVAILLGLIALLVVRGVLTSSANSRAAAGATATNLTPVVVASGPIARGAMLAPSLLKVVMYPRASLPPGTFQTIAQLTGKGPPRTAMRALAANEPVMADRLSGPGGKTNLSGALTPGMRAVSVRSSDVAGVGGFVLPGDRVDVMLTRSTGSEQSVTVTQILAENALVLGVDQVADLEADKATVPKTVTLEVSPDQAQALTLAQSVGTVSLALRQISDGGPLSRRVTTVAEFGGVGPAHHSAKSVKQQKAAPSSNSSAVEVRVIRGVEASGYTVGAVY